jgi:hypothetical protein
VEQWLGNGSDECLLHEASLSTRETPFFTYLQLMDLSLFS